MERGLNRHILSYKDPSRIDSTADDMSPEAEIDRLQLFVRKLAEYGLMEHEIIVLVEKCIRGMSFGAITKEHGFLDARTTFRIYKGALKKAELMYTRGEGN